MADDVGILIEGTRTYRVLGLQGRAQAVTSAGGELEQIISERAAAADTALAHWRGAHATTSAEEVNRVLRSMGRLRRRLREAGRVLSGFPESPGGSWLTEAVGDVGSLVDLPDAGALVAPLVEASAEVSTFTAGVALAFEHGDQALLDLLAEHPEAALGVVDVLSDGRVDTAEGALAVLQTRWDEFDTAAEGGDTDGIVSYRDLRAIIEDGDGVSPEIVAAATFLLHNRRFFRLLETAEKPGGGRTGGCRRRTWPRL